MDLQYSVLGKDIPISDDIIPVISPNWRLKKSGDWNVLWKYQQEEMTYSKLPLLIGATLPLLNGKLSIRHLSKIIQYTYNMDYEESKNTLTTIINEVNKNNDAIVLMNDGLKPFIKEYDALDFIDSSNKNGTIQSRLHKPLSITTMFTNECETNCIYCYANRRKIPFRQELSTQRWIEIFHEAYSLGIESVSLSGGDPLFRKDSIQLIGELINLKMLFLLSTKCHITKNKASQLADVGMNKPINQFVREIQISMDGANEPIADLMAGSSGYFKRAIDSTRNLVEKEFNFRVKAVLTPFNSHFVYEWVKVLADLGVKKLSLAAYNRSFFRHRDNLFLSEKDKKIIEEQWNRAKEDFPEVDIKKSGIGPIKHEKEESASVNVEINTSKSKDENPDSVNKFDEWEKRTHCSGGRSSFVITPDGKVILCDTVPQEEIFYVGDISNQSIMDIWNSSKLKKFAYPDRDKFIGTLCYTCVHWEGCKSSEAGYCFRNSYFNFGNIFSPPPECPLIEEDGLRIE